ncbi:MAG: hypothetical protein ABR502_10780, partial [Chitinophagaceae bacterium]
MRKFFIVILLHLLFLSVLAQQTQEEKINNLKKTLPSLKGTARVDRLNAICQEYFNIGFFGDNDPRVDSIATYAAKANTEAEKLNYKNGIANAQLFIAFTEMLRRNFKTAEDRLNRLLATTNLPDNIAGHANSFLANIYGDVYNNNDKGIEYMKKALVHFRKINNQKEEGITLTRLCMLYSRKGDFETGVEYCTKAVTLGKKLAAAGNKDGWVDFQ